ncbi:HAD family hydrolase [Flavobacterium difficile]|uniref:HAD family phosphatase n=1 Tax=Flavobacterium difficile TaxID=2709659 RepID=A0ABX0I5Y2_9FLAO|nr:HAD family phosphatase [Flavobacterium difficile]NHM01152.1 HAD family phosphatase [Flavobacterium difficile]
MIEAIIFDLGDVFLNLNHQASIAAFEKLGLKEWTADLKTNALLFETGKLDELQFLEAIQKEIPTAELSEIRNAWNAVIGDFPLERLEFLEKLQNQYDIFLLSNTNPTHIDKFEHRVGLTFAREFYAHFKKIYFSYETKVRKPETAIFNLILQQNNLKPNKTLFVDDTLENIEAAKQLGINTWQIIVGKDDVTNLFDKKIL